MKKLIFCSICVVFNLAQAQSEPEFQPLNQTEDSFVESKEANQNFILIESALKKMMDTNPPSVQQIEASFFDLKTGNLEEKDKLGLRLEADGSIYKSNERILLPGPDFFTQSSRDYKVGIVKPTEFGLDLSVKAFGSRSTNIFLPNGASISGITVGLNVDLYKNFLGRMTKTELKQTGAAFKRAKLERKIGLKTFESNLRKLYWSLVANKEKQELLKSLVDTAERQLSDSKSRQRSGVADRGETARFRSQLSSRKSNLIALEYERSEYLKNLRELIPELKTKKVIIGPYSVQSTADRALECIGTINNQMQTPMEYTYYDEIVDFLIQEEKYQQKVLRAYDDIDIKLEGEFSNVGKDFGLEDSQQDLFDNPRDRSRIALKISMPLDGSKTRTKKARQLATKNRFRSMAQSNLGKVNAFHTETLEITKALIDVLRSQKETSKYLGISLSESRKKFNQGRISIQELISEQDAQTQNKLNEIESNLIILSTLIDYFSIFTETPCEFNRI